MKGFQYVKGVDIRENRSAEKCAHSTNIASNRTNCISIYNQSIIIFKKLSM